MMVAKGGNIMTFVVGVFLMFWRHDKRISELEYERKYREKRESGA